MPASLRIASPLPPLSPPHPPLPGYIRAECDGALLITPDPNESHCNLQYIMTGSSKGFIPDAISRARLPVAMGLVYECKVFFDRNLGFEKENEVRWNDERRLE